MDDKVTILKYFSCFPCMSHCILPLTVSLYYKYYNIIHVQMLTSCRRQCSWCGVRRRNCINTLTNSHRKEACLRLILMHTTWYSHSTIQWRRGLKQLGVGTCNFPTVKLVLKCSKNFHFEFSYCMHRKT